MSFGQLPRLGRRKKEICPDRLSEAPPGCRVCMAGFAPEGVCWRERLQAYGIAPGRDLDVIQQSPVTVVRVDHVELAFERVVAQDIIVSPSRQSDSPPTPQVRSAR